MLVGEKKAFVKIDSLTVQANLAARLLTAQHHPDWPAVGSTALAHVLAGGDDYELVFTAPVQQRSALASLSATLQLPLTRIATIEGAPGLRLVDAQGHAVAHDFASFDHFAPAGTLP